MEIEKTFVTKAGVLLLLDVSGQYWLGSTTNVFGFSKITETEAKELLEK